jgi:hypothetical protein
VPTLSPAVRAEPRASKHACLLCKIAQLLVQALLVLYVHFQASTLFCRRLQAPLRTFLRLFLFIGEGSVRIVVAR